MELQGFPFLNQLDLWDTTDGRPSEDRFFLCVPTSIAAGVQYLTGKHLSPDAMKDAVYGEAWVNMGTSASAFAGLCDLNGVKLYPRGGDCVAIAHEELAHDHPVLFTQQDDYAPSHPDWTHVCVWYKDGPGWLSAMDPFGGKELRYDDYTWRTRMRANEVWIMARTQEQGDEMITLQDPWIASHFQDVGNGQWKCKHNEYIIGGNILKYWRIMQGGPRLPLSNELKNIAGVAYQHFESGIIVFDPNEKLDGPRMPNNYECYLLKLDSAQTLKLLG